MTTKHSQTYYLRKVDLDKMDRGVNQMKVLVAKNIL